MKIILNTNEDNSFCNMGISHNFYLISKIENLVKFACRQHKSNEVVLHEPTVNIFHTGSIGGFHRIILAFGTLSKYYNRRQFTYLNTFESGISL
jgi:hypothetical protein